MIISTGLLHLVPFWTSSRVGLSFIGFLGFINMYVLRINVSVAVVCMVNHTAVSQNVTTIDDDNDSMFINSSSSTKDDEQCSPDSAGKLLPEVGILESIN